MKSKIIVYFAFEGLLEPKENVSKRALNCFTGGHKPPLYISNSGQFYMCENLVTRLENLRNKSNIETVLLIPYDKVKTEQLIDNKVLTLFNRVYCSNEVYDTHKPTIEVTKPIQQTVAKIVEVLNNYVDSGLYYEFYSFYDVSPSILVYHTDETLLKRIGMWLVGHEYVFSFYIERGYMKLYLNNLYLNLLQKDAVYYSDYSHRNVLTMYVGSTKEDLDFAGRCSASILPSFIVEEKVNECGFSSIAHIISTIKSPESNMDSLANYPINAQNELNSFINKIIHNT